MLNQILPKINGRAETQKICRFLKGEFKKRKKDFAVIGLSGGVDSSLAARLCEMSALKVKKVFLPCGKTSLKPKDYSLEIDIAPMVEVFLKEVGKHVSLDRIDRGNIMARTRMAIQYALARQLNGLVVGTENLSEYYLGYFTLHGDQASDINPIAGLLKTQVIELARYLGLAVRTPSAELWQGQTDEQELGFSYEEADPILYLHCLKKLKPEKIIKSFAFNLDLVYKVVERVKNTEYKREEVPKYGKP